MANTFDPHADDADVRQVLEYINDIVGWTENLRDHADPDVQNSWRLTRNRLALIASRMREIDRVIPTKW